MNIKEYEQVLIDYLFHGRLPENLAIEYWSSDDQNVTFRVRIKCNECVVTGGDFYEIDRYKRRIKIVSLLGTEYIDF